MPAIFFIIILFISFQLSCLELQISLKKNKITVFAAEFLILELRPREIFHIQSQTENNLSMLLLRSS